MIMTTRKIISNLGILLLSTFSITSCQKEQNGNSADTFMNAGVPAVAGENATPAFLTCADPIPGILEAPAGNKLSYQAYATGVQTYQVKRSTVDPNTFAWVNIGPSAVLFQRPDFTNQTGTHYAGPSWEFSKGPYKNEKVVAAKSKETIVDPSAIPWLLLKTVDALSSSGNKITFIQRVCTAGGLPPAGIPTESDLGKTQSIPYTATYLFFEKKN